MFEKGVMRALIRYCCAGLCLTLMVAAPCSVAQVPAANTEARARAIVAKMRLDEKIAQVHGIEDGVHFRYVPGVPRLGVPPLRITNGPAGVGHGGLSRQLRATALPAPISVAASWDVDLARRYGVIAGQETRELGSDLLESPDINIIRVPQNGRAFESFSEDPYLVGRLSVASIEGTQSVGALANVKHYLANNQEADRRTIDERIGERALREIYMPGFEASVKEANVASVMCAYQKVNGAFNCENGPLLNDVLKQEWHFKGFVISDYGAVHSTAPSALNGLDLEMPVGEYYSLALKTAVEKGVVPMSAIDDMLVRRYAAMMRFGLFGVRAKPSAVPVLEDGKAAREMAEQGMVLLKNKGDVLPLDGSALKSIALIGPDALRAKTGGGGSSHVIPFYSIEPSDGIEAHMPPHTRVDLLDGCNVEAAVAAAKLANVAIVMVGDDETEGHDHAIELPAAQNELIAAVAVVNPKTIVVLKSGSAMLMPWLNSVAAVLEAWYPGEEDGNAVAAVLFGDVNPSGKLPLTFPKSVKDTVARDPAEYPGNGHTVQYSEGLEVGYRWYQSHQVEPLFPFGFGLSYTRFSYSGLTVVAGRPGAHTATVRFHVTNIGKRQGAEVAQVYVGFPRIEAGEEAPRQLKGFRKIMLAPGESREVVVALDARAFSYWSIKDHDWRVQPGAYSIMAGPSSQEVPLVSSIAMQ
jgi:beta-glucosidase